MLSVFICSTLPGKIKLVSPRLTCLSVAHRHTHGWKTALTYLTEGWKMLWQMTTMIQNNITTVMSVLRRDCLFLRTRGGQPTSQSIPADKWLALSNIWNHLNLLSAAQSTKMKRKHPKYSRWINMGLEIYMYRYMNSKRQIWRIALLLGTIIVI